MGWGSPAVPPAAWVSPEVRDVGGVRERTADFDVEQASSTLAVGAIPHALIFPPTETYAAGPVAQGDASQGLQAFAWRARYADGAVLLGRVGAAEAPLFAVPGAPIEWLALAFEGSGRAVVAAQRATGPGGAPELWVYHFDAAAGAFVWESYGYGRTPAALLDDTDSASGDVQVFFVDAAGVVRHRQQRNRYATAYATPLEIGVDGVIARVVRTEGNRLSVRGFELDAAAGTWAARRQDSMLFPYRGPAEGIALYTLALSGELVEPAEMPAQGITLSTAVLSGILRESLVVHPAREPLRLQSAAVGGYLLDTIRIHPGTRQGLRLGSTPITSSLLQVVVLYSRRDGNPIRISSVPTGGTLVSV